MPRPIERRQFPEAAGAVAALGAFDACGMAPKSIATPHAPGLQLPPLRIGMDRITEFHTPNDVRRLRERTVVNATGYGARALTSGGFIVPDRAEAEHGVTTIASLFPAVV